jgi:endonuclease-3
VSAISTRATSASTDPRGRILELIDRLKAAYPDAACALVHRDPFQLLVATILSAQCTDERVNKVTPALFARYPDAAAMKDAPVAEMEDLIRTTGFFHNKTKSLLGASRRLAEEFEGKVPSTMEELLSLPGVARKTANVVLGTGYGVAAGVVVDTHVYRLSRRLGLTRADSPADVERDLMKIVPREEWILFAHLLIHHGRRICVARKPKCAACPVNDLCPSAKYFLEGKVPPWERREEPVKRRAMNKVKVKEKERVNAKAKKKAVKARKKK